MNKYQSPKAKTDCMTKEPITFDKLPQAVSYLTEQVEKIYRLVETLQPAYSGGYPFSISGDIRSVPS